VSALACSAVTGVDFDRARHDDNLVPDIPANDVGESTPAAAPTAASSGGAQRHDGGQPPPDAFAGERACYPDADGDGVPSESNVRERAVACPPGTTTAMAPIDCDDEDAAAHQGQVAFFSKPRERGGFDYDCSGHIEWHAVNPGGETRTTAVTDCNKLRTRDACENAIRIAEVAPARCGTDLRENVCHWFAVQCGKSLAEETFRIECR